MPRQVPSGFHPRAIVVKPTDGRVGQPFIGVPTKVVIHTTETDFFTPSTEVFFPPDNHFWPHATIFDDKIFQHFPIDVSVFALEHNGPPHTNLANAVQCEVVHRTEALDAHGRPSGQPTDPDLWTDQLLDTLADWVSWVCAQTGTPFVFAEMFRLGVPVGRLGSSDNSPIRFGAAEWLEFNGICGHSNVVGNSHWDPGRLPVERLRARLTTINPVFPQEREKETDMFIADIKGLDHPQIIGAGWRKAIRSGSTADALLRAGVKHLGVLDSSVGSDLIDLETVPAALTDIGKAVDHSVV